MGLLSRLAATISAAAGNSPQIVSPTGWAIAGPGLAPYTLQQPTYQTAVTADLALGNWLFVTATSNIGAWQTIAPTWKGAALGASNLPPIGMPVCLTILNSSGGAIGAFSQTSPWKGNSGPFTLPTNGQYCSSVWVVKSATEFVAISPWIVSIAY